jgi:hypothetical protein
MICTLLVIYIIQKNWDQYVDMYILANKHGL